MLNEQLRPSALRAGLPAAKAALVAVMQTTRSVAAKISMVSLMARSPTLSTLDFPNLTISPMQRANRARNRSLHDRHA
jgi:ABC-type arginine/histidine transport system permease subunit